MDNKKKSMKREKAVAEKMNGKAIPGSGCIDTLKGDIRTDEYLIEHKFTTGDYTLKRAIWEKIAKEAVRDGLREPLMVIEFHQTQSDLSLVCASFVLMTDDYFKEMFEGIYFRNSQILEGNKSVKLSGKLFHTLKRDTLTEIIFGKEISLIMITFDVFYEVVYNNSI